MLNCIIIDDEKTARIIIRQLCDSIGTLTILKEFSNGMDAITYLAQNEVDVIFLDIQMENFNGFEVIESLKNPPKVILTTSNANYALTTYKYDCILDYLVKPILLSQFQITIKKLEKFFKQKKELGTLKTDFITNASHEFRTPLTSISAAIDVILKYSDKLSKEDVQKRLKKIKTEVNDLSHILQDILIIKKSYGTELEFKANEIDLVELVKNHIYNYQLNQDKAREVIYKFSMNKIMLDVDPIWIKYIVINLFSNAIKYSEPPARIRIEIQQEKNEVILSVSDQGIGISKKDMAIIFEPFQRGENVMGIPGTGLGLAVLQKAVHLHHGKIKVISELNKGTEVKVSFPIKVEK